MNKLVVVNNVLQKQKLTKALTVDWKEETTPQLFITICESTLLEIEIQSDRNAKLQLQIEVEPNVESEIQIVNIGKHSEIEVIYNIRKNSQLHVTKFIDVNSTNHKEIVQLQEEGAQIQYILKTACISQETYDLQIYHNAKNTNSDIIHHGINLDKGALSFSISTYIPEGNKGCIANQANRIINLTNQQCGIKPNLFIEEYDVIANHSAHIGSFKEEEIFYLERLGIPYETACKLLLQGFMKSYVKEDIITKIFEKYWR